MNAVFTQMRREWNGRRMWQIGFVLESAVIVALAFFYPWLNSQEQRVSIVHGGTHYVGGSLPLRTASDLHKELAELAADAMFKRNPDGFDNLLALEGLFNTPIQREIINHAAKDANIFKEQSMTQSFHTTRKIIEQAHTSETVDMLVEGDVIRDKVVRGVTAPSDSTPVSILMRLQRNDNWATNGKYEMIVILLQTNFI